MAKTYQTLVHIADVPPKAVKLSLRLRVWQINPAYLADHPEWCETGRVAPSGIAWGDLEDPQEDEKLKAQKDREGGRGKGKKIRRVGNTADVAEAEAQLKRIAGGADVDSLFGL